MKKSLIEEIGYNKELFPILFSNVFPIQNNINARRNSRNRKISTSIHQSEIHCLKIYKDGINLFTEK